MRASAQKILNDPGVLEAIADLKLPEGCVVQCDCWPYGADRNSTPSTHKFIQGLLYARAPHSHAESNQYAFPLPFSPVLDVFEDKIVRIEPLATGGQGDGLKYHTSAKDTAMVHCLENEYYPGLQKNSPREDLKPLQVVQAEGPSFKISDKNSVSWQKWRFRVGFNYREGLTLHDIRYDGRPIFYRLSISEMTVPYGGEQDHVYRVDTSQIG